MESYEYVWGTAARWNGRRARFHLVAPDAPHNPSAYLVAMCGVKCDAWGYDTAHHPCPDCQRCFRRGDP